MRITILRVVFKESTVKRLLLRAWKEDSGVLSFEWVLLVTLLVIGVVGGIAGARDAIIDELGDVAQAMVALDQSYKVKAPLTFSVHTRRPSGATGATTASCSSTSVRSKKRAKSSRAHAQDASLVRSRRGTASRTG